MDILKHYGLIHEEETSLEDREETMFNIAWWFHGKTKQNLYKTKKRRHWKCMCLYNYTYCLFTENKEAVTIKKIVLNFCSCYNLSDFCDKFVCTIIPNSLSWKKNFKSPHICTFYCLWYFPQPQSLNIMFLLINNILLLSLLFRRKKYVNGQISNKYYLCFEHKNLLEFI